MYSRNSWYGARRGIVRSRLLKKRSQQELFFDTRKYVQEAVDYLLDALNYADRRKYNDPLIDLLNDTYYDYFNRGYDGFNSLKDLRVAVNEGIDAIAEAIIGEVGDEKMINMLAEALEFLNDAHDVLRKG